MEIPFITFFELPSYRYWKWGALLLAFIYAFNRVIKVFIFQLHRIRSVELSSSSAALLVGDDEFFTSDDDDEYSVSSSCSTEDEKEMRDDPASISYDNLAAFYDDFRKGSENSDHRKRKIKIRRKRSLTGCNIFSMADIVNGSSVVNLWDGLGLGFGCSSSVSVLDLERRVNIASFPGKNPAVSESSAVVFTASAGSDRKVGLSSWDVRARRRSPAAKAEWSLMAEGPVVQVKAGGGSDKVYVRDDVTGKGKVWDVRNARSPLENETEHERETWWDANGVSQREDE